MEDAAAKSRWAASATGVVSIEGCGEKLFLSYIGSLVITNTPFTYKEKYIQ